MSSPRRDEAMREVPMRRLGTMLQFDELIAMLSSTDLARSRSFYEDVLGLPVARSRPSSCDFRAGGIIVRVSLVEHHEPVPTAVLGWSVPDINSTVRNMSARGVTFERDDRLDQDEWGVWQAMDGSQEAWFKDPDGNVLCLSQA